jgi:hypothetical protein
LTIHRARALLVWFSFVVSGLALVFLALAPALGYPLTFPQALRLLEIVLPTTVGYLTTAVFFVFNGSASAEDVVLAQS